jgi:hypothetical protein
MVPACASWSMGKNPITELPLPPDKTLWEKDRGAEF